MRSLRRDLSAVGRPSYFWARSTEDGCLVREQVLDNPPPRDLLRWLSCRFRDLTAMKSQNTLGIHLALCARLREEESKQQDDVDYLNTLRHLKQLSDNRLFRAAREYCHVLHGYGGNLIFAATVTPEYSAHYLESLVDMPSWEQGGPSDWPWNVKKSEVAKYVAFSESRCCR